MSRQWIGYWFLFAHHRPVRRHRHHEPHGRCRRILRRGPARAGILQRHGDRRRLDERGLVHRHGRARCTSPASTGSRSSWAGPAATCWWRCSSRRICASSASSRFRTFSASATAATSSAASASSLRSCARSPTWSRRSTAWALITSRFTGLEFGIGVFVGLGGILVCSFLGGMRAVTWTQVAQYIILIIAYLTPVVWLVGQTHGQSRSAARLRAGAAEGRPNARKCSPTIRKRSRCATSSRRARTQQTRS